MKITGGGGYSHPHNLKIIRHSVNKGPGGNRNTGISAATGKWLMHLDSDDFFIDGSLKKLLEAADAEPALDTVMFDCCRSGDGTTQCTVGSFASQNLDTGIMTGTEFLKKIPVPWTIWCYLYRRDHLLSTGFRFEENVRLEDTDYSLKYIARSNAVRFIPILVYCNCYNPDSVSRTISKSPDAIHDILRLRRRVFVAAEEEKAHSPEAAACILKHAVFGFHQTLKSFVWRLPFARQKALLREWRPDEPAGDFLTDFVRSHPDLTALTLTAARPVLTLAYKAKIILKRK